MKVDYGALRRAASGLSQAGSQVGGEAGVASGLVSGASGPNAAHSDGSGDRALSLSRLAEVLQAQSRSCAEIVTLFQLLDAQVASKAGSR